LLVKWNVLFYSRSIEEFDFIFASYHQAFDNSRKPKREVGESQSSITLTVTRTSKGHRNCIFTKFRYAIEVINGRLRQRFQVLDKMWFNRALGHSAKFLLFCIFSVFYIKQYSYKYDMQNSRNFDISATELELRDKYLVQWISLKELFKSYNVTPKSRCSAS
jgi:hypothetical protein